MTTYTITQAQLDLLVDGLERYQVKRQDFERFFSELEMLQSLTPNNEGPSAYAVASHVLLNGKMQMPNLTFTKPEASDMESVIPLFTHPAPSTKPADGWTLVPIEPTPEMREWVTPGFYAALLAAAPQGETK